MSKKEKKVRIFSALEVANICGVVNQTAINWIKNNHLKAFTTPGGQYRIYAEDLADFLTSRGMRIPKELKELTKDHVSMKKILIVDDDKTLNDMLKSIFERKLEEYTISQAFDGFEAGRLLTEQNPGCVILDIDLPGINGHTLCKKIKEEEIYNNPIIISISGMDEGEKIVKNGADAFFSKPLDFDELVNKVNELMN